MLLEALLIMSIHVGTDVNGIKWMKPLLVLEKLIFIQRLFRRPGPCFPAAVDSICDCSSIL